MLRPDRFDRLRVALRSPGFDYSGWRKEGAPAGAAPAGDGGGRPAATGRYSADRAELKVDVQSAEVLWRNDELKPVERSTNAPERLNAPLHVTHSYELWHGISH